MVFDPHHLETITQEDWERTDQYNKKFFIQEDSVLDAALKKSEEGGLPPIAVGTSQGKFMHLLARTIGAKRILELGTLGGYSTIWLARALPDDGEIITLELMEKNAKIAEENLTLAGQFKKSKIILGPALESIQKLPHDQFFDLIFIDADKENLLEYFQHAKKLTRSGGIIIMDNVVRWGRVSNPSYSDEMLEGVRRLFHGMKDDSEVEAVVLSTVDDKAFDGFVYALKK